MSSHITFLLNAERIDTDAPSGMLVLDWLRKRRRLVGTKEGCKEGDCGACGVLIGDLLDGTLRYQPVTSCLVPVGELHGKHLVTIEGINPPAGLSPLQAAVVDEGGTQCGFCTPGIIVSMTHCLWEQRGAVTNDAIKTSLSGHLCRCTGYGSLKRAGLRMRDLWTDAERAADNGGFEPHIPELIEKALLPAYFRDIPDQLRALKSSCTAAPADMERHAPGFRIAGGTDLYVQRGEEIPDARVDVLNLYPEMDRIERHNGTLTVGGLTTFEGVRTHPDFRTLVPAIDDFMFLIASLQIRNRSTLAGNVVNASPIGDMTILLLALEAEVHLRNGEGERSLPLHALYRGYKDLDMSPLEIVTAFELPLPAGDVNVNFEKVSKRKCLDIASVNSAIKLTRDGDRITGCTLAIGGVAPIPKFLPGASASVVGQPPTPDTVHRLLDAVQEEIAPISDVRGSETYKRLLARQLTIAHFTTLYPETCPIDAFL